MSIVQQAEDLEYLTREKLIQEAQNPSGMFPGFLVIARLEQLRASDEAEKARQVEPQPTVTDQLVQDVQSGGIAQGAQNPQGTPPGGPPQAQSFAHGGGIHANGNLRMANGGIVRGYQHGGLAHDPDDPEETRSQYRLRLERKRQEERDALTRRNRLLFGDSDRARVGGQYISGLEFEPGGSTIDPSTRFFGVRGSEEASRQIREEEGDKISGIYDLADGSSRGIAGIDDILTPYNMDDFAGNVRDFTEPIADMNTTLSGRKPILRNQAAMATNALTRGAGELSGIEQSRASGLRSYMSGGLKDEFELEMEIRYKDRLDYLDDPTKTMTFRLITEFTKDVMDRAANPSEAEKNILANIDAAVLSSKTPSELEIKLEKAYEEARSETAAPSEQEIELSAKRLTPEERTRDLRGIAMAEVGRAIAGSTSFGQIGVGVADASREVGIRSQQLRDEDIGLVKDIGALSEDRMREHRRLGITQARDVGGLELERQLRGEEQARLGGVARYELEERRRDTLEDAGWKKAEILSALWEDMEREHALVGQQDLGARSARFDARRDQDIRLLMQAFDSDAMSITAKMEAAAMGWDINRQANDAMHQIDIMMSSNNVNIAQILMEGERFIGLTIEQMRQEGVAKVVSPKGINDMMSMYERLHKSMQEGYTQASPQELEDVRKHIDDLRGVYLDLLDRQVPGGTGTVGEGENRDIDEVIQRFQQQIGVSPGQIGA